MTEQYLDTWTRDSRAGRLSVLQQMQLKAMPKPEATRLISGLDQTKAARVIDISHWNGDCDIALMRDQGDVAMVAPKASDGKQVRAGDPTQVKYYVDDWFDRNVQKCYDARVACAPYHYVQVGFTDYTIPGLVDWNWKVVKAALVNKVPKKSYHAYMFDFEEKNSAPGVGAAVMNQLIDRALNDTDLSKVPLLLYTSMSVLNYYKDLIQRVGQANSPVNLFMAQWVYNTVTKTTWDNFIKTIIPKIEMKVLTPGNATWQFLQWTATMQLPGCNGALDCGFFKGEKWRLGTFLDYDYTGTTPPVEPPTKPDEPAKEVTLDAFNALAATVNAQGLEIAALKAQAHKETHTHDATIGGAKGA